MLSATRLGVRSSLHGYVLFIALAGLAVLGVAVGQSRATLAHPSLALGVLAAMAVVTEVAPVSQNLALPYVVSRTTSTPFVIAVLAQWGGGPAVIVGAASALIGDLARRRPPRKAAFNLGQYSLMYGVMAVVYRALGASAPFELRARQIVALVVAGAAGAVVNVVVTQVVRRLERGTPLPTTLPRILSSEAQSWAPEFGIAIVVLLVSQRMPLLTVVLILPLLPIHAAFHAVAEAQARRAEAEDARSEAEAARGQAEQVAEERAQLIDARNLLIRRMKEVDHQKDELLASVTHELRTPASSILGVVRTLSQDPGRFSPQEYMELLGLVLEQAEQLDRLIGQLLLAARLQQPHFVTDPTTLEVVDAAILVHRAGQLASLTYPDRAVHVHAGGEGRLPVRVDRKVIAQILGNLVGNAAKHTPADTPIWIDVGRQGNLAVLAVEDGGSGVPPQLRVQVFERFTQLDERRAGDGGGFGLGLYIARQLARAQGGEVLAVDPSRPGGGARFELRLPLVCTEDAGGAALEADAPSAGGGGGGRVAGGRPAP